MILKLPIIALLTSVPSSIEGFTTNTAVRQHNQQKQQQRNQNSIVSSSSPLQVLPFGLNTRIILQAASSSAEGSPTEDEQVEQVEAELTDDEPKSSETEEAAETETEEEEEASEPEEDPEITSLKNKINDLETQLKQKNRNLNDIERTSEEYTKGGYARKVAEMESFRRSKSIASSDQKTTAKAMALQSFLPIMDQLKGLSSKYEGNEFAKSYNALGWDFVNCMKEMGVEEYTVKEGDVYDVRRVNAVEEVYSETVKEGIVISPVEVGFELEGNVMKLASAVVSLGPEPKEEEEVEVEEGGEGGDSEGGEEGTDGESDDKASE